MPKTFFLIRRINRGKNARTVLRGVYFDVILKRGNSLMKIATYLSFKEKLTGTYLEKFEFIENYGQLHFISGKIMSEKMMDLIDTFLQAQESRTPVEKIIGSDEIAFCKEFYSDFSFFDLIEGVAERLVPFAIILLIFEIFTVLCVCNEEEFDLFSFTDNIAPFLSGFFLPCIFEILGNLFALIAFKLGCHSKKVTDAISISFSIIAFILLVILIVLCAKDMLEIQIPAIYLIISLSAFLLIYYTVTLIGRYAKNGSFKRQNDPYIHSFSDMLKEEIKAQTQNLNPDIVKIYARKYRKKNEKLLKKGRSKLSSKEFFDEQKFQSNYAYRIGIVICFVFLISATMLSDFESTKDAVIFVIINVLSYFIVYQFFSKIETLAENDMKVILIECSERNIEIDELYNILDAEKERV